MRALVTLTTANIKSFLRDRAALFWTLAFPLIFIIMFGAIFTGGGDSTRTYAWVDQDGSARSNALRAALADVDKVELVDDDEDAALAAMRKGEVDGVFVVPAGYGAAVDALASQAGPPTSIQVYTDPTQQSSTAATFQLLGSVLGQVNLEISGRGPAVVPETKTIQTENLTFISYLVPSILGMALMQLGVFAALPLVSDREKLILKRLSATPLRRWQLVGSNVITRLLLAIVQTVIVVGVGAWAFDVQVAGNPLVIAGLILVGAISFISLGYVIASFAPTEDAANGMASVVQFPLMFLSGTFFPIDAMPPVLQGVARALPLTYLSDGLRQSMVGGTPFAPLWVCFAVLVAFLAICFLIASRFFRWQ
jgi:ABC-2 type transport system permease protein